MRVSIVTSSLPPPVLPLYAWARMDTLAGSTAVKFMVGVKSPSTESPRQAHVINRPFTSGILGVAGD